MANLSTFDRLDDVNLVKLLDNNVEPFGPERQLSSKGHGDWL